ncbi:MAG: PQQ-binding-like beta-propeller repeat protein [Vicinamibacterales bacterium]
MRGARTTISCRSIPLIIAIALLARASAATPFFPIATEWRAPLASAPSAPPLADTERVFVSLRGGRLVALALPSGLERWSVELVAAHRPALGAGMLFVPTATEIRALDAATGALRWQLRAGPLAVAAIWRDGWLIAGTEAGELLAIRAADGSLVWRRQAGRLAAAPSIDGDRLLLPLADGRVALAALTTGEERWSRALGGAPGPALADDDRVFVGARDNHFYCLDARDGSLRWRWRTAADVVGLAALDAERVYFVSLDNVLRALDRWNGAQRWRRPLPMRAFDGPLTADGLIVVAGLAAEVLFFDARDGAPAGHWSAGEQLGTPLALTPDAGRIRMVAIAGGISSEWMVIGVGAAAEKPLEPLSVVPGTPLPPEDVPASRGS